MPTRQYTTPLLLEPAMLIGSCAYHSTIEISPKMTCNDCF